MMYDYPIGNIVYYDDMMLQVVAQEFNKPSCNGCVFTKDARRKRGLSEISCVKHGMTCTAAKRRDRHHVIFKEIEQ